MTKVISTIHLQKILEMMICQIDTRDSNYFKITYDVEDT